MEDATSHNPKSQTKIQEINSNNENPSKFLSHFLYKATLVTVFLVLLPLFPFQAPEFINQTVNSRSWELLQLIFVGIAVSYGLFSKKNDDEIEKEIHSSKVDNAQTYVSKLLQVSSVFDDESENPTVIDENKVQTVWNSQYYREEPVVVMAKENPVFKEENKGVVSSGSISQKPLLLPVRSLRQRVFDPNEIDLVDEKKGSISKSTSSSSSSSKRFTSNVSLPKNGEFGGMDFKKVEEKTEENVVLRSPIPWRSRSGRMEIEENWDSPESSKLETRSFRPNPTSKNLSPSPSMSSSSPRKLSNSTSFTSETQAKSSEDAVRKKSFSSPPPPPPPPPFLRKSMLMKSNSTTTNSALSSEKELRRSMSEIQDDVSKSGKLVRRFTSSEPNIREEKKSTNHEMKSIGEKGYTNNMINEKVPNELVEKVLMETTSDDESEGESEDDYFEESSGNGEVEIGNSSNDVGPDVDKKADEFIAKFREQIRLQRIESIRKSTAQRSGKNLR